VKSDRAASSVPEESGVALRVVPNAKKTEVVGLYGTAIKLKVASPALEGKANAAVLAFVAHAAGKSGNSAELISGEKARDKVVRVHGFSASELRSILLAQATLR